MQPNDVTIQEELEKALNKIVDKSINDAENDIEKAKKESKGVKEELNMLFKDIKLTN